MHDFTGIFILQLVQALAKKKCEITVITPAGTKIVNWNPSFCKVIHFRYAPRPFQLLAQGAGGIPAALKNNPLMYMLVPFFILSFLYYVFKESRHCDVIQANWAICGLLAIILKPFHRKTVFVTLRGSDVVATSAYDHWRTNILLKIVTCFATAVITVSDVMAKNLSVLMPVHKKKIFVIHNGIRALFYERQKHCNQEKNKPLKIIFVGSLVPGKGVGQLLQALSEVRGGDFFLNVVGTGPLENALRSLTKELNLTTKVIFTGSASHQDMPQILRQADILILPSHHEGRPNVVLEAMAAGLPVIGTDIDGIRELVQNYQTGILFKDNDTLSLVEAITYFLDDPDKIKIMGQAGREWVTSQGLTWDNTAQKYLDLFTSMEE